MRKKKRSAPVFIGKQNAPSGSVTSVTWLLRSSRVTVMCNGHMQRSYVTIMFICDGRNTACDARHMQRSQFCKNAKKYKFFTACLISNCLHVMSVRRVTI